MEILIAGLLVFFGFVGLVAVIGLLMSYPVMLLWNGCLVDAVAGVHDITWLQAWGLLVLFGILFKSYSSSSSKD
jgi:hypothetical protein